MSTKSKDVSELLEDDLIGNLTHAVVRSTKKPPKSQLPKRADDWFWMGPGLWHPVSKKRAKMIKEMSKSRRDAHRKLMMKRIKKKRLERIKRARNRYKD